MFQHVSQHLASILRFALLVAVIPVFTGVSTQAALGQTCTPAGLYDPDSFSGNDSQKVQAAIDAAASPSCQPFGGTVVLSRKYNITQTLFIKAPSVNLRGPGMLLGSGTIGAILHVGSDPSDPNDATNPALDMDFMIDGVTFGYSQLVNGRDGLVLRKAQKGRILNCRFTNVDRAIHVRTTGISSQQFAFHQVGKIAITNNTFGNSNYCLKIEHVPVGNPDDFSGFTWNTGNIHFTNNIAYSDNSGNKIRIGHIYAEWVDGLLVANNTFFFPGYPEESQTKVNNIYVDHGACIIIEGNELFEAGEDAILLRHVQNINITGNNIIWPGQRIPGNGIRIAEGDPTGLEFVLGTITGNNIMRPTLHGIRIEGGIRGDDLVETPAHIAVTGNHIYGAGDTVHYYGDPQAVGDLHFGVSTAPDTFDVLAVGNTTFSALNPTLSNVGIHKLEGPDSYFSKNFDRFKNVEERNLSFTVTNPLWTSIDARGLREILLAATGTQMLSAITNGFSGQELTFVGQNANTTIVSGTTIRLRNGQSAIVPANGTITLRLAADGVWYEICRSF